MHTINLVWLKRDLRLTDHLPLQHAVSIQDMNAQLAQHNQKVSVMFGNARDCLSAIQNQFSIDAVFSHQEIGLIVRLSETNKYQHGFKHKAFHGMSLNMAQLCEAQKIDSAGTNIGIPVCDLR